MRQTLSLYGTLVLMVLCSSNQLIMGENLDDLRHRADLGLTAAENDLGTLYFIGLGGVGRTNGTEAAKWLRKAADKGHAEAQCTLGKIYLLGELLEKGVAKDTGEAAKWFRKAAEQGNREAQKYLGKCYYDGEGVPKDSAEAIKWFRKIEDETGSVQGYLGELYGVPNGYAEAVGWYRKAAETGNAYAQHNLGRCYRIGQGVPANDVEAAKWYRMAADRGIIYAPYFIWALLQRWNWCS